ncbi:PREDICTED: dihomomethionine N-hydroxylase-like [Tarenaya hassleriana]|uniref:dihomomethionine N-hydroxylase-like n=1 Tax=Tarenaya hassleriana TaxID=28532 RepID=UPI00053C8843|nr:PREDICTED: dihomomethionine N-hydroxylase-like [Tarenaya hassleriana]
MDRILYASAIGAIMYAVQCTRPDVSLALSLTRRYQSDPGEPHWIAVKNIPKYLIRTKDAFLLYSGHENELVVSGYTDASFQSNVDDFRSQSSFVFILNGGIVSWKSSKQGTIADSTIETKYVASSDATKEVVQIKKFVGDLVIDDRIKLWREREGKNDVEDWLDVLISLKDFEGKPLLTPQEIKGECKDVCVASLDNPANNVEWTLAEMLNRPKTLKRAVDELDRAVGKDRLVQESDIPNLNYIKACCRESYRLHTVAPFLPPHVATEDTSLGGYLVPKGSHVLVNRILLGRNPKIWEDPEVFKPERHLNGDGCSEKVSLMEAEMRFVTFGTGRRGCIGAKVGTYMTVMLLARLLQGFTWKLPPSSGSSPGRIELVESPTSLLMAPLLTATL